MLHFDVDSRLELIEWELGGARRASLRRDRCARLRLCAVGSALAENMSRTEAISATLINHNRLQKAEENSVVNGFKMTYESAIIIGDLA